MKGLLIKDFKLLKGQKQFFVVIMCMMILFLATYSSYSFVISYMTIMMGVLTLTTISYDEYENGLGYLFTLPVSRKQYVKEKYLFSFITTVSGLGVVSVTTIIVSGVRHVEFSAKEWLMAVFASFLIVAVFLSLLIPIQLKVGADKSRVAMMIVYGGVFLTAYVGMKVCDTLGIDWKAWINRVNMLEPAVIVSALVVICGAIMGISYAFALRFMRKREF